MVDHIRQQLANLAGKPLQAARTPVKRPPIPPEAPAAVGARETAKELPGAKPCPVRWNEAGALFREQHPGMFRIVVVGHQNDLAATVAALQSITPTP